MSLNITLKLDNVNVYELNITNNLIPMVDAYSPTYGTLLWHPYEVASLITEGVVLARSIVYFYEDLLVELLRNRNTYERYNPTNGWGSYTLLINSLTELISYCHKYPKSVVETDT